MLGLLLALVVVQTLGFAHRIVHAPSPAVSASPSHEEGGNPEERSHGAAALFPAHDDDAGCRLYDGVGHQVFAPPAALVVASLIPASEHVRRLAADFVARRAALFEARGPPLSR
ncbi:MAG TPA: hypothetical protein VHM00_09985 [Caldimonas sp.]|jgi:acetyl-CoA acetyltransferase|nr:hypothetical protein [Caldimonas sp.]HEX2541398.1 hypothetical protein [Caldimonas sp.]